MFMVTLQDTLQQTFATLARQLHSHHDEAEHSRDEDMDRASMMAEVNAQGGRLPSIGGTTDTPRA
jgi:hypothetical protein